MNYVWPHRSTPVICVVALALMLGGGIRASNAFHFPWDQGHDTFTPIPPDDPGPCEGDTCDPCNSSSSPVYVPTGHFLWADTDAALKGRPPLGITRTYNSHDARSGMFGNGWSVTCDIGLYKVTDGAVTSYILRISSGKRFAYVEQSNGAIVAPAGRFDRLERQPNGDLHLIAQNNSQQMFGPDGRRVAESDQNGNVLRYGYDSLGRLTSVSDDQGRLLTLVIDASGRVGRVSDHTGRTWVYGYDSAGNLTAVTDPSGGVLRYEYAAFTPPGGGVTYFHLTRITDPAGVVLSQVTYSGGRVSSYTEAEDRYTYTHTPSTRTVRKSDLLGSTWVYNYDINGLITRETDPLGRAMNYVYNANGQETRRTDELGKVWQSSYDGFGRVTSKTDPLGHVTVYEYAGGNPQPVRITTPTGRVVGISYDGRLNPTSVVDPLGSRTAVEWNSQGDAVATVDPLGNRTAYTYDAAGRRTSMTDGLGRTTAMSYDARGNMLEYRNPAGEVTRTTYDALDRVATVTDSNGGVASFTYDTAGRLVSVTDPANRTTTFAFDAFGRLADRQSPDGSHHRYSYFANNRLSQISQPSGRSRSFGYDAARGLTQDVDTASGVARAFVYSSRGELIQASNGNPAGVVGFSYDDAGRLVGETNNGQTIALTLNGEGERLSMSALGWVTQYAVDGRGFVTQIQNPTSTFGIQLDAIGRRTQLTMPDAGVAAYEYDRAGQIVAVRHTGGFAAEYEYEYDAAGRTSRQTGDGADIIYDFDMLGRLTAMRQAASTVTFGHDSVGNVLANGRVYDPRNNRLTEDSDHVYSYDADGNLILKQRKTTGARSVYIWNAWNELIRVDRFSDSGPTPTEITTYTYDALGRRLTKTTNGVSERYVYDGSSIIGVLDGTGNVMRRNTFGPLIDEPLASSTASGDLFYRADRLGSVKALTRNGVLAAQYVYDPYGRTTRIGNDEGNPFRYVAREQDAPDLYYYRARYYDPTMGRFISEDPTGLSDGYSLFAYVRGNPVDLFDPTGAGGQGERGWSGKPSGSGDEFKHYRPHPTDPNKVTYKHPQTGKKVDKPKPKGFDDYWDKKHPKKNPPVCEPTPEPAPEPAPAPENNPEPSPTPTEQDNSSKFSRVDWGRVAFIGGIIVIGIVVIVATGGAAAPAFASDRRRKKAIEPVDGKAVLKKLAHLPVSEWTYRHEPSGVRHIGPMAQDFFEAFGLGADDKSIAHVDANGVLVAAVQELYRILNERDGQIAALQEDVGRLRQALEERDGGQAAPSTRVHTS